MVENDEFDCLACEKNSRLKNGSCEKMENDDFGNCLVFSESGFGESCVLCGHGFVVASDEGRGVCVGEEGFVGCWYLESDGAKCESCRYNYFMDAGECFESGEYFVDVFGAGWIAFVRVFAVFLIVL